MQVRSILKLLLLTLGLSLTVPASDTSSGKGSFYIVVNVENSLESIEKMDLVNIYLGKQTLWKDGGRVTPAMLKENRATMKQFIELVLNKTVPQYRAYWKRRLFSGGGTVPKTFRNSKALVNYVARVPGSVGITSQKIPHKGVRYIKLGGGRAFGK